MNQDHKLPQTDFELPAAKVLIAVRNASSTKPTFTLLPNKSWDWSKNLEKKKQQFFLGHWEWADKTKQLLQSQFQACIAGL